MPEIQEVFRMATQKVRPDPGALERQHGRERRHAVRQRVAVFALVAALVAGAVIAVANLPDRSPKKTPLGRPTGVPLTESNTEQAVIVGLDGTTLTRIPEIPWNAWGLSLSPDGTTIAFAYGIGRLAETGITGTGHFHEVYLPFRAQAPAWSPDGSKIAFEGTKFGNRDIFVMNTDGSDVRRLTRSPYDDEWPAWSPDGATILYDNTGKQPLDENGFSQTQELYTIPSAGGTPTPLTRNRSDDSQASYSPDGTQIVYHHEGGIWLMNADGSGAHVLDVPGRCCTGFTPRFSPDGSKIAFTRYDPTWRFNDLAVVRLYVKDLASGEVSPVGRSEMSTDTNPPQWMPSGDSLFLYRVDHP